MAQYTEYHPLKFWLDPASIAEIVAHIQTYLVNNPINSTTEIETIIHDYLIAHPELIGGVDSVNGQTGEVVLTADNISAGESVTIKDVLDSLQDQINDIIISIPSDYQELIDEVSDLKNAFITDKIKINPTFTSGYINAYTLIKASSAVSFVSNPVFIPAGYFLEITNSAKNANASLLTLCDDEGNNLKCLLRGASSASSDGRSIIYPFFEDSYVKIGYHNSMENYKNYYIYKIKDYNYNFETWNKYNTIPAIINNGFIGTNGIQTQDATGYQYFTPIVLPKGASIEFWSGGKISNVALSEWRLDNSVASNFSFVRSILACDGGITHSVFTADNHMLVRISAKTSADLSLGAVCPYEKFIGFKIYSNAEKIDAIKNSNLFNKKIAVMGDSLIEGNHLNAGSTWITDIGIKYNMNFVNLGISGSPVALTSEQSTSPMVGRIETIPADIDYFVLLGGANDKRYDVPIGEVDSSDNYTFSGAVNTIVNYVRSIAPKCRILLMTTYQRYASINNIGLGDIDYANAMINSAKHNCVPSFDNYHNSGITFLNNDIVAWLDESNNYRQLIDGVDTKSNDTHHFSIDGYSWVSKLYERLLNDLG